ncbi:MAG: ArgK/MeaB family GTPase [Candidatus Loosdrechtia sp.]|uniref:ArgK/MeaB family GTPase n=1 Tax=Candidatus Loosdrechtia sp. TaxID=3101272 RepID=UPI003A79A61E|nr:MAG: GTP-binding protein [Candidatus Jettenia sp. AMX2]
MNEIHEILQGICAKDPRALGRAISIIEEGDRRAEALLQGIDEKSVLSTTIIGVTGSPGVGKSTLINQLISYYRKQKCRIGIVAIDPSSPVTRGAFLGDRIRMMGHVLDQDVVIRSMAARGRLGGLCAAAGAAVRIMAYSGCNPVIVETAGVGQAEAEIVNLADVTVLVLAPGMGDDIQVMKAGLIEIADIIVINKADLPGVDALMMEIESVTRERDCLVCRTIATDATGIEQLAIIIRNIDQKKRRDGQFVLHRQKVWESEVLNWAMEMMRGRLMECIRSQTEKIKGDPRVIARTLIEEIWPS